MIKAIEIITFILIIFTIPCIPWKLTEWMDKQGSYSDPMDWPR